MGVLDDAIRQHLALRRKHGASDDELAQTEAEALGPARRETPPPPESAEAGHAASDQSVEAGSLEADQGLPEVESEPVPDDLAEPTPATAGAEETFDEPLAEDEVPATELLQENDLHPPGANGRGGEVQAYEEELPEEEHLEDELAEDEALDEREPAAADEALDLEPEAPAFDDPRGEPADALEAETVEHEPVEEEDLEDDADYPGPAARGDAGDPDAPASDADEDVLEETPDFLRDTPEHERLWFEQKPPRNFDLDE